MKTTFNLSYSKLNIHSLNELMVLDEFLEQLINIPLPSLIDILDNISKNRRTNYDEETVGLLKEERDFWAFGSPGSIRDSILGNA